LLLIFVCGVWLRFQWLNANPVMIENEGGEYARLAENIFNRVGYIGTQTGTQLLFPPLYPLLTSLLIGLVGDSEVAGRLVSLLMGSLLFIPIYLIITTIYTRKVAFVGAILVAFHPYLIEISTTVLSEATYLFFMGWALYGGISALYEPSKRKMVYSGLAWGLAYLVRTEGSLGLLITLSMIVMVQFLEQRPWRKIATNALCLVGTFLLLIAPYLLFLYFTSGQLRFENKSLIVYTISERMLSGMSYQEAALAIDHELKQVGPELNNSTFVLTAQETFSVGRFFSFLSHFYYPNAKNIFQLLITLATPLVILLVPLGLFRRAWHRKRMVSELYLLTFFGATLFLLLSIAFTHERYVTSFLPILLIWAAMGTVEIADWLQRTVANLNKVFAERFPISKMALGLLLALLLLLFFIRTERVLAQQRMDYAQLSQRNAGLWLREQMPGPKVVMSTDTATAYYSGSTWAPFPYATDEVRLAYVEELQPTFIVLYGAIVGERRPDLLQWYQSGIPDAKAQLIYHVGDAQIYRWKAEPQSPP